MDIQSVLRVAEQRNQQMQISGMLCWSGEFFLQCLEGDRAAVTQCFSRIAVDPRHHSVELILSAPTTARWFSQWGMGFSRTLSSHRIDSVAGNGGGLNPYLLQPADLESTFERLSKFSHRMQAGLDVPTARTLG
jgi:hypothetical protein